MAGKPTEDRTPQILSALPNFLRSAERSRSSALSPHYWPLAISGTLAILALRFSLPVAMFFGGAFGLLTLSFVVTNLRLAWKDPDALRIDKFHIDRLKLTLGDSDKGIIDVAEEEPSIQGAALVVVPKKDKDGSK
jgi:hypothetical protein